MSVKKIMHQNWRTFSIILSILFDMFGVVISSFLVPLILQGSLSGNDRYFFVTLIIGCTILFIMTLFGVYRAQHHYSIMYQYLLMVKSYILFTLIAFTVFFILRVDDEFRRCVITLFFILPVTLLLTRIAFHLFQRHLRKKHIGIHKVLLAGYDNGGLSIVKRFRVFKELGYEVIGLVTNQHENKINFIELYGDRIPQYPIRAIDELIKKYHIDRIFVPSTSAITNGYSRILSICQMHGIKLKVLSHESERTLRIARVYDITGITIFSPDNSRIKKVKEVTKRLFDIVVSITCIIILSPIFILTALAIYLESGFPILFKHERTSIKGGKKFIFLKFRSMKKNADELKDNLYELNESNGALFKIKYDPRVTRVGRIIRKFSIDELPQLFNVLKGDMSIVGPRPLPVGDFEKSNESDEFWESIKDRAKVKPGMTGLWQISGRSSLGFRDMIWLDLYYVENQSLLLDLEISFATIPAVFLGRGAY